jgi:hypothetical protein
MIALELSPEHRFKLKQLGEITKGNIFQFLGFELNLETNNIRDVLQEKSSTNVLELKDPTMFKEITELLINYSKANKKPRTNLLVKFKTFPGGYAYENAFIRRAITPISELFGDAPEDLIKSAKLLEGKPLQYGQASVEIEALPGIPITYVLWVDEELPPSANILFDKTAGNYLNVEDLSGLAELTTWRLTLTNSFLKKAKP